MKIAIVGYGREGQSSYKYFSKISSNDITICDIDPNISVPNVKIQTGDKYLDNLNGFDLIVRSSGINPKLILNKNPNVKDKITTQLNIFLKNSKSKNIIGVTGTKGKGTTSTLIHKILTESGYQSILAGNIGIPFLDVIDKINPDTWVVLELSSFQLDDLKEKSPHISLCLMISEDHINWHGTYENYLQAKSNLFKNQNESDIAIYLGNNKYSKKIANYSPANKKIPYMSSHGANIDNGFIKMDCQSICDIKKVKLLGSHNLDNICAAVTACWQITNNIEAYRKVIFSFEGLKHRLEFVRDVKGVKYYNDSFASNISATIAAIEAIDGSKILILGGFERFISLDDFIEYINENREKISKIVLIGESTKRVKLLLNKVGIDNHLDLSNLRSMKDIVVRISGIAQPNDSVILSPGFASFDMFKNFEDRGNQYKQAVNNL